MADEQPNEGLENEEENPQSETDPVEERFARLESSLTEIANAHRGTANYVGGLGRQIEKLLAQPPTPARDERVDMLLAEMQDIKLSLISDPEERERAYQQTLAKAREVKPEPKAEPIQKATDQEEVERIALNAAYLHGFKPGLARFAAKNGMVGFENFWQSKVQPKVASQELARGKPTADDPLGWEPLADTIEDMIRTEVTLQKNQGRKTVPIDTNRSTGGRPPRLTVGQVVQEVRPSEKSTRELIAAGDRILDQMFPKR